MDLLKLTFLGVVLTLYLSNTKAMGLCEFAEKSPCEDIGRLTNFKNQGCTNQTASKNHTLPHPVTKDASAINSSPMFASGDGQISSFAQGITKPVTTDQVAVDHTTTDQITTVHAVANQVTSGDSTTGQVTITRAVTDQGTTSNSAIIDRVSSSHETTYQVTTGHSTTDQAITGLLTTDHVTSIHPVTDQLITGRSTSEQVSPGHPTIDKVNRSHTTAYQVATVPTGPLTFEQVTFGHAMTDQVNTGHSMSERVSPDHLITGQVSTRHAATDQLGTVTAGSSTSEHVSIAHAVTNQVTTDDSTSGQMSPRHSITTVHSTPDQVTSRIVPTDNTATNQGTTGHLETDHVPTPLLCPPNMVYAHCATCQGTCGDPEGCISNCTEPETCVCHDGRLFKGDDCVHEEECECFMEGHGVIPEGGFRVTEDCSLQCNCSTNQLICDDDYQCSVNAFCDELDSIRRCYCNEGYSGDGVTCTYNGPTDCLDVFNTGNTDNGIYTIKPTTWNGSPFEVYCSMADGGGWTVFQRRLDGTVNFNLYWDDFKDGFGSLSHEHWLGNEKIFSLTNQRIYELQIDFINYYTPYYAKYDSFRINNEANNYRLIVGSYIQGNAGDSLTFSQNNEDFSTRDQDNDDHLDYNIAAISAYGAWWYGHIVYYSDLNADYDSGNIYWKTLPGDPNYIKFTEMKIRPV